MYLKTTLGGLLTKFWEFLTFVSRGGIRRKKMNRSLESIRDKIYIEFGCEFNLAGVELPYTYCWSREIGGIYIGVKKIGKAKVPDPIFFEMIHNVCDLRKLDPVAFLRRCIIYSQYIEFEVIK
jgi:hypothetical protein